jgi:hypothetical protein
MRIDSSGNVMIGITSSSVPFYVYNTGFTGGQGTANTYTVAQVQTSTNTSGLWFGGMSTETTAVIGTTTASGNLAFQTYNGSSWGERLRILSTGGITFNGDTSTNNALDDYEEGTWTAAFAASTTNATGYYTKVGNTVFFTVYGNGLNVTSTGTSAAINGLPFTNNGGYTVATITHDTYTNNSYNGYVQSGGTSIHPIQDGTVSSAGTVAGTPKYIMVSGTYITNA